MPDIDIDFADRDIILDKINHRVARLNKDKKHNLLFNRAEKCAIFPSSITM